MLSQSGYELLDSFYPETTNFAVFLLAKFDLSAYTVLTPAILIKFGINKGFGTPRTETNLIKKVDDLVSAGFLEYGPFVRGRGRKPAPTVRIRQHLLMPKNHVKYINRRKQERLERMALIVPAEPPIDETRASI